MQSGMLKRPGKSRRPGFKIFPADPLISGYLSRRIAQGIGKRLDYCRVVHFHR
jgi:hypothetical protein